MNTQTTTDQDLQDDCKALLHSLHRRMTGREIAVCQAGAGMRDDIEVDLEAIQRLRTEFSAEIAQAKRIMKL